MEALLARGRSIADEAVAAERERIAARIGEEMPGLDVTTTDVGIGVAGQGLRRRLLDEPQLRWIGSLVR